MIHDMYIKNIYKKWVQYASLACAIQSSEQVQMLCAK